MTIIDLANAALADDAAVTPGPWTSGRDPSHFDAPEITDGKTFAHYIASRVDAAWIATARYREPLLARGYLELTEKLAAAEADVVRLRNQPSGLDAHRSEVAVLEATIASVTGAHRLCVAELDRTAALVQAAKAWRSELNYRSHARSPMDRELSAAIDACCAGDGEGKR